MQTPLTYSIRSMLERRTTTLLTGIGLAAVVFVFTASRMLSEGLERTMVETGSPQNAIVIRRASNTEVQSVIMRDSANVILTQPEIATAPDGQPFAAAESVVLISLPKRGSGDAANVVIRGVDESSAALRPEVRLVEGRMYTPGTSEVIAARQLAGRFEGLGLGEKLHFGQRDWTVVGLFDAGGTAFDSEIWGDAEQLLAAYRRSAFSSITLRLRSATDLDALRDRLESDPRLTVDVKSERDYYAAQTETMSGFISVLGGVISVLFSLGAVIGAMITMYAAVANRVTEIGTLRALGFRRRHVLAAFLAEAIALSIVSGAIGIVLASALSFVTLSTTNWDTFSEVAFQLTLAPRTVATALGFSLVMGVLGGFLPAVRAARLDVVDALRAA